MTVIDQTCSVISAEQHQRLMRQWQVQEQAKYPTSPKNKNKNVEELQSEEKVHAITLFWQTSERENMNILSELNKR